MFNKMHNNYSFLFILLLAFASNMLGSKEAPREQISSIQEIDNFKDAIEAGDFGAVKKIANAFPRIVNELIAQRWEYPLQRAAEIGHVDIVRFLISRGAKINEGHNGSPLCRAVEYGHRAVVEVLLQSGARVSARCCWLSGAKPLHHAKKASIAELLISYGAATDARDRSKSTPLHTAASQGRLEVVRFLVTRGAAISAGNEYSQTPLHEAVSGTHDKVVAYLLANGADVNATTGSRITVFGEMLNRMLPGRLHFEKRQCLNIAILLVGYGATIRENDARNFARLFPERVDWTGCVDLLQGTMAEQLPRGFKKLIQKFASKISQEIEDVEGN